MLITLCSHYINYPTSNPFLVFLFSLFSSSVPFLVPSLRHLLPTNSSDFYRLIHLPPILTRLGLWGSDLLLFFLFSSLSKIFFFIFRKLGLADDFDLGSMDLFTLFSRSLAVSDSGLYYAQFSHNWFVFLLLLTFYFWYCIDLLAWD